jgi:hypothetical protein
MNLGLLGAIAFIALIAAALGYLSRAERQRLAQREAQWLAESATKGWTLMADKDGLFQRMRWQGQTDGVAWTLEYRRGRHKRQNSADRAHRMCWWASAFQGPPSPVLCMAMNKGQEQPSVKLAQGEGMLAALVQKAAGAALDKTLDVYFGEEAGRNVDARLLKMVETVSQPGYLVMAQDEVAAEHWLAGGCGAVLAALVNDTESALHPDVGRPWVLWVGRQVMLANMRPVNSMAEVERMVKAGVSLTNA